MAKVKVPKNYLLDTSIILDDPENIEHIYQKGQNRVFITDIVLSELNKKKELHNETGFFAREFFRMINSENGKEVKRESLFRDIPSKSDDHLREMYLKCSNTTIPIYVIYRQSYRSRELEHGLNDAKIVEIAKDYRLKLLTNDIALKIQALAQNIEADSLRRDRVENPDEIEFFAKISVPKDYDFNKLSKRKAFSELSDWSAIEVDEEDKQEGDRYLTGKKYFGLKVGGRFEEIDLDDLINTTKPYIKPINLEQKFYYSMLIHPQNRITVCTGSTGSGKTLIALQAGLWLVKQGVVDGIVYIRNTVTSTDKEAELGFRKGDEATKLSYFMYPLYSAINFTIEKMRKESINKRIEYAGDVNTVQRQAATELFMNRHNIEVYDIAHARGITIARKFVIFDEVQNSSNATVKLIGTRIGEDSRIVFLGDWTQIDHPYLSKFRNGLVTMLKKAKEDNFVAGIQLRQTIRSEVAGWFQKNL